jgi:TPR repeat protein
MTRLICALVLLCQLTGTAVFAAGARGNELDERNKAFRKWQALAERGNAAAQFNVGLMFARGQGVGQDLSKAATWYRRAAKQGHAKAQLNLGYMYARGHGVPGDPLEATRWFHLAAMQGHAIAQANLGRQFYSADGVPEDYPRSWAWFDRAAAQGDRESRRNQKIILQIMSPAQIVEAQELSRELCAKIPNCTK